MTKPGTNAKQLALEFYGPMYMMYSLYDGAGEKEEILELLWEHIDRFSKELEKSQK